MTLIKNPVSILGNAQSNALVSLIGGYDGESYIAANDLFGLRVVRSNTFYYNYSLASIELPESVEEIEEYAFYSCFNLESVVIPSSITYIGDYAFQECSALDGITVLATTPPEIGSGVFNNSGNCPIYVPAGSVSDYQSDSNWSQYSSRIEAIQS